MSIRAIRHAINNMQPISATYQGRHRILCPHVIGTKNGVWNVLSYQAGGESSSGLGANPANNWRCMRVAELRHVEPAPYREWQTAPRDTCPKTCVGVVDTEVAY
jgi:predicted DNA-binding transcriptional regulator YafY